jgi:hypothetical protein
MRLYVRSLRDNLLSPPVATEEWLTSRPPAARLSKELEKKENERGSRSRKMRSFDAFASLYHRRQSKTTQRKNAFGLSNDNNEFSTAWCQSGGCPNTLRECMVTAHRGWRDGKCKPAIPTSGRWENQACNILSLLAATIAMVETFATHDDVLVRQLCLPRLSILMCPSSPVPVPVNDGVGTRLLYGRFRSTDRPLLGWQPISR